MESHCSGLCNRHRRFGDALASGRTGVESRLAHDWPIWSLIVAPFSYVLLHGGVGHLALNGVMLAIIGQVLERRCGRPWFLLLFAAGAVGGGSGAYAHRRSVSHSAHRRFG